MYKIRVHTCLQGSVTYKPGIDYPCAGEHGRTCRFPSALPTQHNNREEHGNLTTLLPGSNNPE